MSPRVLLVPAVLISLAFTSLLALQKDPKPDTARFGNPTSIARPLQDYIYGVVKKADKNELILDKTISGVDEVFKLEPKTKVIRDGKQTSLEDLKVGDQVFVEVKKNKKTGDRIARKVITGASNSNLP